MFHKSKLFVFISIIYLEQKFSIEEIAMGNREAKFKKVFEEIDMNGDHKVSFFELAAFIISPKAVHELEEFTKALFINNVSSGSSVHTA